ncbi:unnamed protein product, partial [Rotaria socialis]
LTVPSS